MNKYSCMLVLYCSTLIALLVSCSDPKNALSDNAKVVAVADETFTDARDGQIYKTVKIDNQVWMAENLNYDMGGSYCYGDKSVNCIKYGRLYSLDSARKACPAEWRLPTPTDWSVLIYSMGGESVAGKYLKSLGGWIGGGNGSGDYGFSALPAGEKYGDLDYNGEGKITVFWGDYGESRSYAYGMYLDYYTDNVKVESMPDKRWLSIRCIKENIQESSSSSSDVSSSSSALVQDSSVKASSSSEYHPGSRMDGNLLIDLRDNQVYKTVKIGTQTWMAENLNYKTENSSCQLVLCTETGRYYTWDDAVKACPDGWHLPTRAEWKSLISFVGGHSVAGKFLRGRASGFGGTRMRGPMYEHFTVDGTNEFGFLALEPEYWSSTEDDRYNGYYLNMPSEDGSASVERKYKSKGLHVRCLLGEAERVAEKTQNKIVTDSSKIQKQFESSLNVDIAANQGLFTDTRDGKTYKTIKIGSQTWMAENLNYKSELSFCFAHDSSYCPKYGRLYGRAAAKNACPTGWHLPSLQEWDELFVTVGGQLTADIVLKSKTDWKDEEKGYDLYGFTALPAGYKTSWRNREFKKLGEAADFWTSTECESKENCLRTVSMLEGKTDRTSGLDSSASSIRCLKDESQQIRQAHQPAQQSKRESKDVLTDSRDGQIYRTVKIGSQTWMAENLKYETKKSSCYNGNANNCVQYGRLYEWDDVENACPAGWHLPSLEDWEDLFITVGNRDIAAIALKSKTGWRDSIVGTDDYGFTALPAGSASKNDKSYQGGYIAYWWSTANCSYYAGCKQAISLKDDEFDWRHGGDDSRYSVRCLKDAVVEKPKNVKVTPSAPLKDARDGHTYKTVKIGSQTWMAENLNYGSKNSACHGDSTVNCDKYGRFYTWYGAIQCEDKWIDENGDGWGYTQKCAPKHPVQGVCPDGWHLPSLREWSILISEVGGEKLAGTALKSKKGWALEMNGSDDYGFTAIPVVYNKSYSGTFTEKNDRASFWSSTDFEGDREAYHMSLTSEDVYHADRVGHGMHVGLFGDRANLAEASKSDNKSVRCVKDKEQKVKEERHASIPNSVSSSVPLHSIVGERSMGSMTDSRDGKSYKTVTIGSQTWMAQNLNYKMEKSICRNDTINDCASIGRLYSWNLAKEACPSGWRLPAREDWDTLFTAVGGQSVAGTALKSSEGWYGYGNGSDAYGFSAFPIIVYGRDDTYFMRSWNAKDGRSAFFWSFTDFGKSSAYVMYLLYYANKADFDILSKEDDFSVRCIKGELPDGSKTKMIEASPLTDARDGKTYKTVKIGKQIWMAENLNFAAPNTRCSMDSTDKDSLNSCAKYGRYYKWATAMDSAGAYSANAKGCGAEKNCLPTYPVRGICPEGWHLPSRIEWNVLFATVGGIDSAGKALKTVAGWKGDSIGSDDYGFSALPYFSYWSSTEDGFNLAYYIGFDNDRDYASLETNKKLDSEHKIRCVMDVETPKAKDKKKARDLARNVSKVDSNVVFDSRDGQIYKTVKIGSQTWMAENLNFETEYSECLDNYAVNCSKYGRLYPWSVAMDSAAVYSENGKGCGYKTACFPTEPVQGVCPDGWHLPSNREWVTLFETVGGQSSVHAALKTTYGWKQGSNGSNEFGFSALPASIMQEPWVYRYDKRNNAAFFWSSTKYNADEAQVFLLHDQKRDDPFDRISKNSALSVRCIKNELPKKAEASSDSLSEQSANMGKFTDPRDGQTYKTVTVGNYTWMAENMKYETENTICYDDNPVNCANYGRLYEWKALKTVCPVGWHLPTEAEWDTLFAAVGGPSVAGKKLKSKRDWLYCKNKTAPDNDGNGTDEIGFSVRPVGFFHKWGSVDESEGYKTCFHTAEKDENSKERELCFSYCSDSVARTDSYTYKALSVRCIKDYPGQKTKDEKQAGAAHVVPPSSTVKGTFKDPRDGQTYKTVKIGKQTWIAQNLNYKTKNRKCLEHDSTNCDVSGSLYPWADAMKACPAGFHLPTETDWNILIDAVGDSMTAARALKSSEGWAGYKDVNGGGPDEYGFSAQPISSWYPPDEMFPEGTFSVSGYAAAFWTTKEFDADSAYVIGMANFYSDIEMYHESKQIAETIRCVKNK